VSLSFAGALWGSGSLRSITDDRSVDAVPQFTYVLGLASTTSSIVTSVNPDPETCNPTGTTAAVDALILRAVANLKTNLTIQSVIQLDDYSTPLNFVQNDVVTVLDKSVLNLVGLIGKTSESHLVHTMLRSHR
jgi:hypothetical protein